MSKRSLVGLGLMLLVLLCSVPPAHSKLPFCSTRHTFSRMLYTLCGSAQKRGDPLNYGAFQPEDELDSAWDAMSRPDGDADTFAGHVTELLDSRYPHKYDEIVQRGKRGALPLHILADKCCTYGCSLEDISRACRLL